MSFSRDFVWGCAAAAFQIEGATREDGRTPSIWDTFCQVNGRIKDGQNSDKACDHYHRYKEDIDIMASLGLDAYRMSVSWSRLIPGGIYTGSSCINQKALDFYNRVIDSLLEKNITPWMTLYHWDMPYSLYERGSFLSPDFPLWFADYAAVISRSFSDRVKHFFTFNEPQCSIGLGYKDGCHAPGHHAPQKEVLQMIHHILLAHGRAVTALRENAPSPINVGMVSTHGAHYPVNKEQANIDACRCAQLNIFADSADKELDAFCIPYWHDPIYFGQYPQEAFDAFGADMPRIGTDDMKIISAPVDFLGVNIYNGSPIEADPASKRGWKAAKREDGYPRTAFNWPVTPESLYWLPSLLNKRYNMPVYITENGMSNNDIVSVDGKVHDPQRIDFLHRYLSCLSNAIDDGADIRGFFLWSILDNFEWAAGYSERFGVVHVDYTTLKRTVKDSGYWYKNLIETGKL